MTPEVLTEYMECFFKAMTPILTWCSQDLFISPCPPNLEWCTHQQAAAFYAACKKYNLLLYIDGARLGYGLAATTCTMI